MFADEDVGWAGSRNAAIALSDIYLKDFRDDDFGCRLLEIMTDRNRADRHQARSALVDVLGLSEILDDEALTDNVNSAGDVRIITAAENRFSCSADAAKKNTIH